MAAQRYTRRRTLLLVAAVAFTLALLSPTLRQAAASSCTGARLALQAQRREVRALGQRLGSKEAELAQAQEALRAVQEGWSAEKDRPWMAAHNQLLNDAKDDLYHDSLVLRARLREDGTAAPLKARWRGGGGGSSGEQGGGGSSAERLGGGQQRGVVIPAGGARSLANAFVSLHVLRHHLNCSLPAAIMYWGASAADAVDPKAVAVFKGHLADVEFIDASSLPYPDYHQPLSPEGRDGSLEGFKVKVFSLYAAPFEEVLLLDSDSFPLLDPSCLFDTEEYRSHGNLFWPDYWTWGMGGEWYPGQLYDALHLKSPWEGNVSYSVLQGESGQLLIDRARHWQALEWLLFLNTHQMVTYRLVHGDKDTYRAAFHLAGNASSYQQVAHRPALTVTRTSRGTGKHKGMLQLHPNGTAMFHHHNRGKFEVGGGQWLAQASHITARATEDLAAACIYSALWMGCPKDQIEFINPVDCDYNLYDWPATERSCAPSYDLGLPRGQSQRLPALSLVPGSYFATAEDAADAAFALYQQAMRQ